PAAGAEPHRLAGPVRRNARARRLQDNERPRPGRLLRGAVGPAGGRPGAERRVRPPEGEGTGAGPELRRGGGARGGRGVAAGAEAGTVVAGDGRRDRAADRRSVDVAPRGDGGIEDRWDADFVLGRAGSVNPKRERGTRLSLAHASG